MKHNTSLKVFAAKKSRFKIQQQKLKVWRKNAGSLTYPAQAYRPKGAVQLHYTAPVNNLLRIGLQEE